MSLYHMWANYGPWTRGCFFIRPAKTWCQRIFIQPTKTLCKTSEAIGNPWSWKSIVGRQLAIPIPVSLSTGSSTWLVMVAVTCPLLGILYLSAHSLPFNSPPFPPSPATVSFPSRSNGSSSCCWGAERLWFGHQARVQLYLCVLLPQWVAPFCPWVCHTGLALLQFQSPTMVSSYSCLIQPPLSALKRALGQAARTQCGNLGKQ